MKEKGQTLIEAVLAITIITVIITALVTAVVFSLNASGSNSRENQATNYAQEGIEALRNMKETDYASFSLYRNDRFCLGPIEGTVELRPIGECSGAAGEYNLGNFKRSVYINDIGRDQRTTANTLVCSTAQGQPRGTVMFVASTVVWNDNRCEDADTDCHQVEVTSCFTDL